MKVLLCQIASEKTLENGYKKVENEISRRLDNDPVDMVILPELAFTKYAIVGKVEADKYAEMSDGKTFIWASATAIKYNCYIIYGYVEKAHINDAKKYYDSLMMVGRDGNQLYNYRKTRLFESDNTWATSGGGFGSIEVPELGKVVLGICADVNPEMKDWDRKYDESTMDFAKFARDQNAKWVILIMTVRVYRRDQTALVQQTHWLKRLQPLIGSDAHFCIVNRVGGEHDAINKKYVNYSGSSIAGSFSSTFSNQVSDQPNIMAACGMREEFISVEFFNNTDEKIAGRVNRIIETVTPHNLAGIKVILVSGKQNDKFIDALRDRLTQEGHPDVNVMFLDSLDSADKNRHEADKNRHEADKNRHEADKNHYNMTIIMMSLHHLSAQEIHQYIRDLSKITDSLYIRDYDIGYGRGHDQSREVVAYQHGGIGANMHNTKGIKDINYKCNFETIKEILQQNGFRIINYKMEQDGVDIYNLFAKKY